MESNRNNAPKGADSQTSQTVYRTANACLAEHRRLILALCEIRSALIQRDPLHLTAAVAEVIVATSDCDRAITVLRGAIRSTCWPDWDCQNCREPVPGSFDLCWNCGTLHPSPGSVHQHLNEHTIKESTT